MLRIRGHYMHTASVTGRITIQRPSLCTIPNRTTFRLAKQYCSQSELAIQQEQAPAGLLRDIGQWVEVTVNLRDGFVAQSGCLLVSADYAQIELRLVAHFSQDPDLIRIFHEVMPLSASLGYTTKRFLQSKDPFRLIAAEWLHRDEHAVTTQERDIAKQVCYALIYGQRTSSKYCCCCIR